MYTPDAALYLSNHTYLGQPDGLEAYTKGVNEFIPKMCDNVETDEEVTVVVNSLEAISDMLKECKQDLTNLASHPEKIVLCISKIMKDITIDS